MIFDRIGNRENDDEHNGGHSSAGRRSMGRLQVIEQPGAS